MRRRTFVRGALGLVAAAGAGDVLRRPRSGLAAGRADLDLSFLHPTGPDEASVLLTGDAILYRSLEGLSGPGVDELFGVQRDADVAVTNCELVFSEAGYPLPKDVAWAPPAVADQLAWQGIDMVTVANNHLMDLGSGPMLETLEVLRARGIVPAGGGADLDAATAPAVVERKGVRIGLLSFLCMPSSLATDWAASADAPGLATVRGFPVRVEREGGGVRRLIAPEEEALGVLEDAVARARPRVDVLLVGFHMHWGDRYRVDEGKTIITRLAVEAGADLVFAHGPHVINPVERYRGRLIFHSLGNFIFHIFEGNWFSGRYGANWPGITKAVYDFTTSTDFWEGLAPRLVVGRDGVRRVQVLPVLIDRNGDPRFPDPERGRAIVEDLAAVSDVEGMELGEWHLEV